jgi:hypothetical protein
MCSTHASQSRRSASISACATSSARFASAFAGAGACADETPLPLPPLAVVVSTFCCVFLRSTPNRSNGLLDTVGGERIVRTDCSLRIDGLWLRADDERARSDLSPVALLSSSSPSTCSPRRRRRPRRR